MKAELSNKSTAPILRSGCRPARLANKRPSGRTMTNSAVGESAAAPVYIERDHAGWLVVLGSTLALIFGNGPIILFTFGVLLQPISAEFGWQRSVLASAVVVSHIAGAVMMPFVG